MPAVPLSIVQKEHLTEGATMFMGTRDKFMRPHGCRVFGARIEEVPGILTLFIQMDWAEIPLANLLDNGHFALAATVTPTYETYQFKGIYLSHEPSTAEDLKFQTRFMNKMVFQESLIKLSGASFKKLKYKPSIAITVQVNEIFDQTPKQGTGNRIAPINP